MVVYSNTSALTISTVTGGGTYTMPAGCRAFQSPIAVACAYTLASVSGATSVSVTMSGTSNDIGLSVREYSFTKSSAIVDNTGALNDAACTSCAGVALTLTGTNDVIAQVIANYGSGAITAISSPYGNLDKDGSSNNGWADSLNTMNGSAPTWTKTGSSIVTVGAIAIAELGVCCITLLGACPC